MLTCDVVNMFLSKLVLVQSIALATNIMSKDSVNMPVLFAKLFGITILTTTILQHKNTPGQQEDQIDLAVTALAFSMKMCSGKAATQLNMEKHSKHLETI